MNWYRCDACGTAVQLDSGDKRLCAGCHEAMKIRKRHHKVVRRYAGMLRETENQYEMEEMTV